METQALENYKILHTLYLGDREINLGMDQDKELPYMVCDCNYFNAFNIPMPSDTR